MGLGDSGHSRERMPGGPHGVAVRVGLWPSGRQRGFPRSGADANVGIPEEVPATSTRLENLRRRLVRAFQCAVPRGDSRRSPAAAAGEEETPASMEGALAVLRAELVSAPGRRWDRPRLCPLEGFPAGRGLRGPFQGLRGKGSYSERGTVRVCSYGELSTGRRFSPTVA